MEHHLALLCRAVRGGLKVIVAGRVRYPDAIVTCSPIPRGTDIVPEPVVVFEVLPPGTAAVDRIQKNEEYRETSTIRRYVMLEQTRMAATVFERVGEDWVGEDWVGHLETGAVLPLPEVGVELPMAAFYARLEFEAEPDEG